MTGRSAITAVAAVLLLTGCGGSTGADSTTPAPEGATSASTSSPSPTPTTSVATVEQYASIIASNRKDVAEWAAKLDECAIDASSFPCQIAPLTADMVLATFAMELRGADDDRPENQGYIGAIPPEIEGLMANTDAALRDAQDQVRAAKKACPGKKCQTQTIQASFAMDRLVDQLDGWEPYL